MTKKSTHKKICIYLDQFAVSDMIESIDGSLWFEIKKELLIGYEKDILFCPLSSEHFIETSQKSIENAKTHDLFFNQLSNGYCIKSELFITSQLISSRIRKNKTTIKTYMYENVNGILDNEQNYNEFDRANHEFRSLISKSTGNLNSIRKETNTQKILSDTKKTLLKALKVQQSLKFINRLKELKEKKGIIIKGDKIGDKEIPNWIDLVIDQLLKRHKFTEKEIIKLVREFKTYGFENIPTLDIRSTIESYMSLYSKQENSNDHIDIMRIATGLPIADILLTDKKRKAELIESKLSMKYHTKIFSGVESDLNNLLNEIKNYTQRAI